MRLGAATCVAAPTTLPITPPSGRRMGGCSGPTHPHGPHLGAGPQLEASFEGIGVVLAGQVGCDSTEVGVAVGQDRSSLRHSHRHGSHLAGQIQGSFMGLDDLDRACLRVGRHRAGGRADAHRTGLSSHAPSCRAPMTMEPASACTCALMQSPSRIDPAEVRICTCSQECSALIDPASRRASRCVPCGTVTRTRDVCGPHGQMPANRSRPTRAI